MALAVQLFLAMAGLLAHALPGPPTPAPPGQASSSRADSRPTEPGQPLGVRLVNGSSRCSGTVELWRGSSWEPACGAFWNHSAAEAVCGALGCGGAEAAAQPALPTGEMPQRPDARDARNAWNTGNARNASGAPNATQALALVVLCGAGAEWRHCRVVDQECSDRVLPPRVTCAENQVLRLVGSNGPCAGRVEMLEHGQWGSVCDDTWDLMDAHVVCRQLGCGWAVHALPGLHFAPGQGPIHRDEVNCSGAEAYLWDCPGLPGQGYCGHKEDAGVLCSEHQSWRLTGGADACEGRVEVYFREVWSTVCDSEWYWPEASVLCRALGCGNVTHIPKGEPHSLPGRMFYSCEGGEPTPSSCLWRFNNSNLCSQSQAAWALCSGSRSLLNLSTSEVPTDVQPSTEEPSVTVVIDLASRELRLLIPCIILGILLLGSLLSIVILLLKVKGKYALPIMANHQHLPTTTQAGVNSYQEVPNTIPKEDPKPPIPAQPPQPEASDSDSDYEHYDFNSQPPVALTTFYNSQRYRVTDEEVRQNRFQMPPLEEGPEEAHASGSYLPARGLCVADTPSLGPQHQPRSNSGSSTSSGEDYCNSPRSRVPPWHPPVFPSDKSPLLEPPPNLELAGSQGTFSGPSADDSSSTSSGEWYQNYQPPPQPPPAEHFGCPGAGDRGEGVGPPSPQPESTDEDYDDIGAA